MSRRDCRPRVRPAISQLLGALLAVAVLSFAGACGSSSQSEAPSVGATSLGAGSSMGAPSFSIPPTGEGFRLTILKKDWLHVLDHKTTVDETWPVLSQIDLSDPAIAITATDVDAYSWSNQTITLTDAASATFLSSINALPSGQMMQYTLFVASLNGVRLYGGMFLAEGSQMGIEFPVINFGRVGQRIAFALRPGNTVGFNYPSLPASLRTMIEIPEVHDYFQRIGKLAP